ncbi:MAG: hypothetical protein VXX78_00800, partial [Pseudomonadota bacterium]|nr:hypothetical protein [Pseudomonadota bacterium]
VSQERAGNYLIPLFNERGLYFFVCQILQVGANRFLAFCPDLLRYLIDIQDGFALSKNGHLLHSLALEMGFQHGATSNSKA